MCEYPNKPAGEWPHIFSAALAVGLEHSECAQRELRCMLDEEFNKRRALLVRGLRAKLADPFIRKRSLALAARYERRSVGRPSQGQVAKTHDAILTELEQHLRRFKVAPSS
jgi:hypothetical protein